MALIHCDFYSETLQLSTSMCVILPQALKDPFTREPLPFRPPHPTLWLLHGLSDDHTIWQRRTSVERYAQDLGLAVVMPAVGRSFYTDMVRGLPYWTFVSEELPRVARSFFPLSEAREDNFVAGQSMGGYGAFKLALTHPGRYAAAASLSGVLDLAGYLEQSEKDRAETQRYDSAASLSGVVDAGRFASSQKARTEEFHNIFGSLKNLSGSENDILQLASELAGSSSPRPALYQCCGTEDFLYDSNISFRDHARRVGLEVTYKEAPGDHVWDCWDKWIQDVLEWLPLKKGSS